MLTLIIELLPLFYKESTAQWLECQQKHSNQLPYYVVGCQEFRILAIYLVQLGRFQTQCGGIKVEGFYTPYLQQSEVIFGGIVLQH